MARLILGLGAGEPPYSSAQSLAYAFRALGHDLITVGPGYFGRYDADILLPDRPHIEYYSPDEVLEHAPWPVDILLTADPHFFLKGPKPPGIPTAMVATDSHRAASLYYEVLSHGCYDWFINCQAFFSPLFWDIPGVTTVESTVGFDPRRFPQVEMPAPECDIVFVGQAGLNFEYDHQDEIGRYATKAPAGLPTDIRRYTFSGHPGLDYCERGELLALLCKDFRVRIYERVPDECYQAALRKGAIGFHRSLKLDIALRCLEVAAAGRLLVADFVPELDDVLQNQVECVLYRDYRYFPLFANFAVHYREVYKLVKYYLDHDTERDSIAQAGWECAWDKHQWQHKAKEWLEIMLNR